MCLVRTGVNGLPFCRFLRFGAAEQGRGPAKQRVGDISLRQAQKMDGQKCVRTAQAPADRLAGGVMEITGNQPQVI